MNRDFDKALSLLHDARYELTRAGDILKDKRLREKAREIDDFLFECWKGVRNAWRGMNA